MSWKFKQIEPQPARGTLREEMWESHEWISEEKYDGDRRIAQFCGKVVRFTGRRKSVDGSGFVEKTENVPHLSGKPSGKIPESAYEEISTISFKGPPASLDGTVLDGEMIANGQFHAIEGGRAGGMSKYVTSIMGSLPEEAVRKQIERGWLRYVVFDCLFYKGKDIRGMKLDNRRLVMEDAINQWKNPFVSSAKQAGSKGKRRFYDEILAHGGEGVILKHVDHVYGDKARWVKVKGEWTADVVIMGFVPAKEMSKKVNGEVSMTKYAKAGLIGAIQCGQYIEDSSDATVSELLEVATVSGISDDLRKELTAAWLGRNAGDRAGEYVGSVIEIAHNGREPTGRFRHPRFKRFRNDKKASDCIYREGEI